MKYSLAWGLCLLPLLGSCGSTANEAPPRPADCARYCALAQLYCRGANLIYRSADACAAACATFPTDPDREAARGNSLQCRLTYLAVAQDNARVFCLNARPSGGVACQ